MSDDQASDLASRQCVPCKGGVPPLTEPEYAPLLAQLPGWEVIDGHHLKKRYRFPDFMTGLAFVNRVAEVAEQNGHHPDVHLYWGRVEIEIYTHTIKGLAEGDFVLAAKCDRVL